ncbi:MAG: pyridoxamine 5'-phosphate oxidase family protein [Deltaproteobacteria bacterium]|jgi:nitroimidazol reductase NimA-like FMN-containing flavoprotein (pyridoxamine 5'-phosphate oxidase superfamily)|nr:pyridoxamine 5'-phosphate oxidase family protein [Deltaproteobacteria bacterium]
METEKPKRRLTEADTMAVLDESMVAALSTIGEDGAPYATPVHYATSGRIAYVHGSLEGTRNENIRRDPRVSLTAWMVVEIVQGDKPCRTGTAFKSIVATGRARIVTDAVERRVALDALVAKYSPQHVGRGYPEDILGKTGIVAVEIVTLTGKYR